MIHCHCRKSLFELIDTLSCKEKRESVREEEGQSERKRKISALGEVKALQPNTS